MIRDRIVLGIKDNHTCKMLLQEKKLDLQRCIDICRSTEKSESQLKSKANVHQVKVKQHSRGKNEKRTIHTVQSCRYCGRTHLRCRKKCLAFGQTCNLCGEQNYFERKCPNKKPPKPKHHEQRRGALNHIKPQVHGIETHESELDNGSIANILPTHVYVRLTGDKQFQNLKKTNVALQMYNKSETKAVGTIRLSVRNPCNRKKYNLEFVIVPGK